jgi:hypothetical protein
MQRLCERRIEIKFPLLWGSDDAISMRLHSEMRLRHESLNYYDPEFGYRFLNVWPIITRQIQIS